MNHTPEISVIVPVYKAEKYLAQCIDSILAQTFTDFELLLIDDGSPDRCGEICDEYARKDNRIRVFHQKNAGVSMARNKGLDEAVGKYVIFVDSDDYVLPQYIFDLYKELPVGEGEGVIIETVVKSYPDGTMKPYALPDLFFSSKDKYRILTELGNKEIGYPPGKLYNLNIIREHEILFLPTISLLEDHFFLLDYVRYADFVLIRNVANYIYRVGYSTETLSARINSAQTEYMVFSHFLKRIRIYQEWYGLDDDCLADAFKSLTGIFCRIIVAIYKPKNVYAWKVRLDFFHKFLADNGQLIKKYFQPQYLADKIAKFLLCHVGVWAFDGWMRLLWSVKFKKMFGVK